MKPSLAALLLNHLYAGITLFLLISNLLHETAVISFIFWHDNFFAYSTYAYTENWKRKCFHNNGLCSNYKVDYQEKQFAQGVIPTTFMRREGAPRERELLCGRLIDRPIRPLFPAGFYHEVQVCVSV